MSPSAHGTPRIAIVLSGGGARGAYEAGVLKYVLDELPASLGHPVHFSIITGTSIGAIHACFLAATGAAQGGGARLERLWREIGLTRVFRVGASDLLRVPRWVFGRGGGDGAPPPWGLLPGLLDTAPLEDLIAAHVDWPRIHGKIESGSLDALAVTATEIATGRSVVFVDTRQNTLPPWPRDRFVVARSARIVAQHALASAAIPVLFPARQIDGAFFCDGGLRLNTPLSPALHLGADRVLVIGLRHPRSHAEEDRIARQRESAYLNPAYLLGKVLNALLLDRVENDVAQLHAWNDLVAAGVAEFGPAFLERLNHTLSAKRGTPLRSVDCCFIQPSEDLGELAGECLARSPRAVAATERIARLLVRAAARGTGPDKDLLSYVLFDSVYAERLLELGRRDALRAHDQLVGLLKMPG